MNARSALRIDLGQSKIAIAASGPAGKERITWDKKENIRQVAFCFCESNQKRSVSYFLEPWAASRKDKLVSSYNLHRIVTNFFINICFFKTKLLMLCFHFVCLSVC